MSLESYVSLFARLRPDKSQARWRINTRHMAPHKPLLLLAVLDLFAEGGVSTNLVEPSPELGELFTLYWSRVMPPEQRGNFALPFFHLKNNGFWHLQARPDKEQFLAAVKQIKAGGELRDAVFGARLDEDLYALLQSQSSRDVLRRVLTETYFAPEAQAVLTDQGVVNQEAYQYSEGLLKKAKDRLAKEGLLDHLAYRPAARDQGFRRAVIGAYNHTCAFCRLRVLTPDGHTAADAAHIIPWSRTRDDSLHNGMALCKLCHWAFDEGLMTASAKYRVTISPLVSAEYNGPAHLPTLKDRSLALPADPAFWPDLEALKWHSEAIYRTR